MGVLDYNRSKTLYDLKYRLKTDNYYYEGQLTHGIIDNSPLNVLQNEQDMG